MTSDQDVYRKVGRGGAGNFHVASPADKAAKVRKKAPCIMWFFFLPQLTFVVLPKDLEAQVSPTTTAAVAPPSSSTANGLSRAGRGGAGNYIAASDLPNAQEQRELAAAVSASLKKHPHVKSGLAGRGGAGNYTVDDAAADSGKQGEEVEDVERRVREEVDKELKMPDKVHRAYDRGEEE